MEEVVATELTAPRIEERRDGSNATEGLEEMRIEGTSLCPRESARTKPGAETRSVARGGVCVAGTTTREATAVHDVKHGRFAFGCLREYSLPGDAGATR
jgi:hypothetical protein